jgi:hypothetical protein
MARAPNKLTADKAKQLRYLLREVGRPDLIEELGVSPRSGGKPEIDDSTWLAGVEAIVRLAEKERGLTRDQAQRWFLSAIRGTSLAARLRRKIKLGVAAAPLADLDLDKLSLDPPPKRESGG